MRKVAGPNVLEELSIRHALSRCHLLKAVKMAAVCGLTAARSPHTHILVICLLLYFTLSNLSNNCVLAADKYQYDRHVILHKEK